MEIRTVIIDPLTDTIVDRFTYNHCDREARRKMADLVRRAHINGHIIISANFSHCKITADPEGVVANLFEADTNDALAG